MEGTIEYRQAVAARNLEAILDAAETLVTRGAPLTFSALAGEAGVSRPTVYAHFADRPQLLTAVLERSLRQAVDAIESAGPDDGPASEALRRVIDSSWAHLARHHDIARAIGPQVTGHGRSVAAAHHEVTALFARLVRRGRSEGSFRDDLPEVWLVNACLGLIHAAAATAHARQMGPEPTREARTTSIIEL